MKRTLWRVLKWLLGAGVLAGLVWLNREKLQEMLDRRDQFDPNQLVIAGLVFLAGVLLTFVRWFLLVRAQDLPFRQIDAVRLGFVSLFFSAFLPGSVGGDLVKAGYLAKEQNRRTVAIATIILDRIIGLVGLILLAGAAGVLFWDEANAVVDADGDRPLLTIVLIIWGLTGGMALAVLLILVLPFRAEPIINWLQRIPKLGRILAEVVRAVQMYRHKYRIVALATALAVLGHICFVLSFYFSARALPEPIPSFQENCLLIPVGMVVESVPLTPGNIGVGEAFYDILYQLVDPGDGVYKGKGALARLGQRLVYWVIALIGFCFYLPLRGTVRQIIAEGQTAPTTNPIPAPKCPVGAPSRAREEAGDGQ